MLLQLMLFASLINNMTLNLKAKNPTNGVAKSFLTKKKTFNLKSECIRRRNLVTVCADSYKLPKWLLAIIAIYGIILIVFQRTSMRINIPVKNVKSGARILKKT